MAPKRKTTARMKTGGMPRPGTDARIRRCSIVLERLEFDESEEEDQRPQHREPEARPETEGSGSSHPVGKEAIQQQQEADQATATTSQAPERKRPRYSFIELPRNHDRQGGQDESLGWPRTLGTPPKRFSVTLTPIRVEEIDLTTGDEDEDNRDGNEVSTHQATGGDTGAQGQQPFPPAAAAAQASLSPAAIREQKRRRRKETKALQTKLENRWKMTKVINFWRNLQTEKGLRPNAPANEVKDAMDYWRATKEVMSCLNPTHPGALKATFITCLELQKSESPEHAGQECVNVLGFLKRQSSGDHDYRRFEALEKIFERYVKLTQRMVKLFTHLDEGQEVMAGFENFMP